MSELVNDLPRRETGVRGGAGDEHLAARPLREIRKRAGHFGGHANRSTWIVNHRNDGDDVDGDVDAAGEGRDLFRRQPAPRVDAVGQNDDGTSLRNPTLAGAFGRHQLRRVGDGIVQRCLSVGRLDAIQCRVERRQVRGERRDTVETRIEAEECRLVARPQ
jgi:hypothetical protein